MKKLFLFSLLCSSIFSFSTHSQEKIIFSEDFSNNSRNWLEAKDTNALWKIENGKYYRENFKKMAYTTFKPVDINTDNNFSISLTATHLSGVSDFAYGLIFGTKDVNNRLGFVIAATGQFKIYKTREGVITDLVKWTESSAIKKDNNADNVLMLKKQGSDWKFYINDQFLTGIPAEPFMGYGFGLNSEGMQAVAFDNLVVKESNASVATLVKEDVLFIEDFVYNTRNWPEYDDEYGKVKISNFKYNWENLKSGNYSIFPVYLNERGDFSISLKAVHTGGENNYPFGICFGFLDVSNLFEFDIYADGYFVLYKVEKGKDSMLINETISSAIKKGNNASNDLKIKKEGSMWKLYINDMMVASHPALNFFGNKTGMSVYGKQKVEFDDLIVKQLNKVDAQPQVKTVSSPEPVVSNNNAVSNNNEPYKEDFSTNANNWNTVKNDSTEIQLKDGKYFCNNKRTGDLVSVQSIYLPQAYNYSVSISASHISGVNTGGYGLLFGHGSGNAFFAFEITTEGNFHVIKSGRGNSVQELVKWTASSAIKKGNNTVNTLTVQKDSTTWKFLINNQQVGSCPSERLLSNGTGIIVKQKQLIAFDNLEIKRDQGTYAPPASPRSLSTPGSSRPPR
jgi:hypothetical protein